MHTIDKMKTINFKDANRRNDVLKSIILEN